MVTSRLLIVCLGNICRSPMAEGIVRQRIDSSPLAGRVIVDSAGTGDWHVGQPPDQRAIATAARSGVAIAHLRGRQLADGDADRFDWVLCADRTNLRDVRAQLPPASHPRTALLLAWAGLGVAEVPDPYTGDVADFQRVWELLDRAADGIVRRLLAEPASRPPA